MSEGGRCPGCGLDPICHRCGARPKWICLACHGKAIRKVNEEWRRRERYGRGNDAQ